jgi:HK97 gp10 family phage protein
MRVTLKNRKSMLSKLEEELADIRKNAEKAVYSAGIQTQAEAKKRARVDTGRMRSSIMQRVVRENNRIVAYIGTNVEYAKYIEYGIGRIRAYPFMRPAFRIAALYFMQKMRNL